MVSFSKKTRSRAFLANEAGNVAMMTAVALLVLTAAMALSLDISKGTNTKSRLADAADGVSLYIARSREQNPAQMRQMAEDFLNENYPGTSGDQIQILSMDWDGDAFTVRLSDVSEDNFPGLLEGGDTDVSVSSTSVFTRKIMDIALVLDSTGSMGGSKMANLKVAGNEMVNIIDEYADTNVRMSVVPFAHHVNVGVSQRNAPWSQVLPDRPYRPATRTSPAIPARIFEGCLGSRGAPTHLDPAYNGRPIPGVYRYNGYDINYRANCGTELLPLTTNFSTIRSKINALVPRGWTYMPAGLMWGWRTLDESDPFSHSSDPDVEKVLILMTDGENTVIKNGPLHVARGKAPADQETSTICTSIKDEEITVYTIAYEVSSTSTQRLLLDCASGEGNYYDARNAADLRDAFEDIANSLIEVRLTG